MKNEKYLLGDLENRYYLSDRKPKGFCESTLQVCNNIRNNIRDYGEQYKNHFGSRSSFYYSNNIHLSYIVTHPMNVQKYGTTELYTLEEGIHFKICLQGTYPIDTGLVLIETDDETVYVASLSEMKFFAISVFTLDVENYFIPFELLSHKVSFWNENLDCLFQTFDIRGEYQMKFVPLVAVLKDFILLQDESIYSYFLPNILNILIEAKNMINSDLSTEDKEELLKETKEVLEKLKSSINDISKFQYDEVKSVEYYIQKYYEKEQMEQEEFEKAKQKQLEEERALEQERIKKKKAYLETIKAKSELLDYFNAEMIKIG